MADRQRIVRQWRQGTASVLVTLVHAEGSSYRRPGAHLLIGADGKCSGTISGGCLEAEVVRKAAWMVRGGARVEQYSTLFDDTAEVPYGLGCGGVVDLLLEPVATPECNALLEAIEQSLMGIESRAVTWLPEAGSPLRRAIFSAAGDLIFASAALKNLELEAVRSDSAMDVSESSPRRFVENLSAPQRLIVLGAGEDAKPVVEMAALLGWRVMVADGRAQMARPERFAKAQQVVATQSIAEFAVCARDAVVLMTHSYEQDRTLLTQLLGSNDIPGYIGLLGASHRSSLLISEAAAALGQTVEECCERVWAPVGLDLGGDGAEAIALAVIAEVQAWREGRLGSSRRLTSERVAEHIAAGGASRYLRAQCALDTAAS